MCQIKNLKKKTFLKKKVSLSTSARSFSDILAMKKSVFGKTAE